MKNNPLDDIIKCNVEISSPGSSDVSFDSILLVVAGPAAKGTANKYLQKMYDKDKKDGTGTFSVNIADLLGNEKFTGSVAWVTKPASWARGKAQGNREWEIAVGEGQFK